MDTVAEALFVDYGQPNREREQESAQRIAEHYDVALAYAEVSMPVLIERFDLAMVIPGRNLVLVALAAQLGAPVVIGANLDDREMYEDCRAEFFAALGATVRVEAPLLNLTKPEIGALAESLGVPVELTWSCYYPVGSMTCNACDACLARDRALGACPCATGAPCDVHGYTRQGWAP
jgi:7-cyano-7-deazaguanine synthase